MRALYSLWAAPGLTSHIDWHLGEVQPKFNVYSPNPWFMGQESGASDISGAMCPRKLWNNTREDVPIIVFKGTPEEVKELRNRGFHSGYWRNNEDIDVGLHKCYTDGVKGISHWCFELAGEVSNDSRLKCVLVWHPEAELDDFAGVQFPTFEANTLEEAMFCLRGNSIR